MRRARPCLLALLALALPACARKFERFTFHDAGTTEPDAAIVACSESVPCKGVFDRCIEGTCQHFEPERISGFHFTAGSGTTRSSSVSVRVNVGAPQPMGSASSTNYRVQIGPRVPSR